MWGDKVGRSPLSAPYMQTSRHTIYDTLQRWKEEQFAGLDAKPKTNKGVRKASLQVRNEIRKLQDNPLLGEYRVHTALKRLGIEVSPATCGRIMAANRQLYGLEKPKREGQERAKLEMPFRAERRHQFWSADARYIEEHLLPDPKPVYAITIFENFSRHLCFPPASRQRKINGTIWLSLSTKPQHSLNTPSLSRRIVSRLKQ